MKVRAGRLYSTYSIVARDPTSGELGVAVQTHQMTVGAAVPWLEAGVGALATQSLTNIKFGPMGLALLRQGTRAERVVDALVATDEDARHRQLAVVDSQGDVAVWTGEGCIGHAGHYRGDGFAVQANMMTNDTVVEAMAAAYQATEGDLARRMMAALEAAQAEDGDIRGMQSAVLTIVPGEMPREKDPAEWRPRYDLRVDEHEQPVLELKRLVRLRRAQLVDREGHRALDEGDVEQARSLWAEARKLAPELEELPFWQGLTLADEHEDLAGAVAILRPMLADDPRREHWLDLILRVADAGLYERERTGAELMVELADLRQE